VVASGAGISPGWIRALVRGWRLLRSGRMAARSHGRPRLIAWWVRCSWPRVAGLGQLAKLGAPLGCSARPLEGDGQEGPWLVVVRASGSMTADREGDAGLALATAVVVRSGLPRWLRYGWAVLVTVASCGGWVVDHCSPPGAIGAAMRSIRSARNASSPASAPGSSGGPPAVPAR
jgi:hypothetical protein